MVMEKRKFTSLCFFVCFARLVFGFQRIRSVQDRVMLKAARGTITQFTSQICLNHAGDSPSPQPVIDRAVEHLNLEQMLGGYAAAREVADDLDDVYQSVVDLIQARSKDEVALVESATVAWTRAFYAMAENQLKKNMPKDGCVILISEAEYAANVVAATQWARQHNWTVLAIPSSKTKDGASNGVIDLQALECMLSGTYEYRIGAERLLLDPARIVITCITHVPTNSGITNPVQDIGQQLQEYNLRHGVLSEPEIFYLVDACQSVGHLNVNVRHIHCHALVATGRKYLRGPRGTGFLYVSSSIQPELWPSHIDHYGVPISQVPQYDDGDSVETILQYEPRKGASRFEFWESNISNRLALGVAIRDCIAIGCKTIEESCISISSKMRNLLEQVPHIMIHHSSASYCGIVTFYSSKNDSASIVAALRQKGFELSLVPSTSTPIDSAKSKVPDLVRASVSYVTTREEVDQFIESLKSILVD